MAAIYQWFIGQDIVFTTTLYPISATESANITIELEEGYMQPIPTDYAEQDYPEVVSGDMYLLLYDLPEIEDEFEADFPQLIQGHMYSPLSNLETDDEFETDFPALLDGDMIKLLIIVDSPDEKLDLSCAIEPGDGCYMQAAT